MPFTLSHPAAVLPLRRVLGPYAVLSALVIGSMAPDLPYFLALPWPRMRTHTLWSTLWFALPAGWLAYGAYRGLLRPAADLLAPDWVRARVAARPGCGSGVAISVSLVVGAVTHVGWDAFTHGSSAIVQALPALTVRLTTVGGYQLFSYKLLQHASTLLGAAVLVASATAALRRAPVRVVPVLSARERLVRRAGRAAIATLPVLLGVTSAVAHAPRVRDLATLSWFTVHSVVAGLTTAVTVLIAIGLCRQLHTQWAIGGNGVGTSAT